MALFPRSLKIDHDRVLAAIREAEQATSGEIRVAIDHHRVADPVAAATREFERLGMTRTAHRNGVLIFLAPESRKFAVIGDTAIHEKCGDAFWRMLTAAMAAHFQRGDFVGGLEHGIARAGRILSESFPRGAADGNELPDDISESG